MRCRCTRLIELFIQQRHTNSVLLIIKLLSDGGIPAAYERKNIDPIVLDLLIFFPFFFLYTDSHPPGDKNTVDPTCTEATSTAALAMDAFNLVRCLVVFLF